jgi:hypothetical protein
MGMSKTTSIEQNQILFRRLASLRADKYPSQELMAAALSAELGYEISRDRYSKYETRTVIPRPIATAAAKLLGCPLEQLLDPDYPDNSDVKEKLPVIGHNGGTELAGTVPVVVIGSLQAGLFREALEWPPDEREILSVPVNMPYADKPLQGFKIVGDSMNDWYPHGSYVVVYPTIHMGEGWMPATGQHVIVQRKNDWGEYEATVKEVAYEGGDLMLWPRSHNPDFKKPWRMKAPAERDPDDHDDNIRITGLVVWSMRRAPGT